MIGLLIIKPSPSVYPIPGRIGSIAVTIPTGVLTLPQYPKPLETISTLTIDPSSITNWASAPAP